MGRGAEVEFGDLWGPWTLLQGSKLQRWISWETRPRLWADWVVLQNQEWAGVRVNAPQPLCHEIWVPMSQCRAVLCFFFFFFP